MTTERDRVVDFTTPYYDFGGIQILMRREAAASSLLAFANVFTGEVWACWVSVLILTGVLVCAFENLGPYGNKGDGSQRRFRLKESLWLVTASVTMAGPECTPRTTSSRVMVAGFWFFCSVMMAAYTANLAAFLTTSRLSVPIESLEDLAKQSTIRYSVVGGTVNHEYFQRMAAIELNLYQQWKTMSFDGKYIDQATVLPPTYAVWDYPLGDQYITIWNSILRTGLVNSSEEGLARVLAGNFAFIHESPMVQYEVSRRCDLIAVGKQFSVRPYAFALAQDSPLTNIISYTILELQSQTVLETLKTKWWDNNSATCSPVDESAGLTFHTVGGIFTLVFAGILLGCLTLLVEWTCFLRNISSQKNKNARNTVTSPNSRTNLALDFNCPDNRPYGNNSIEEYNNIVELSGMY